MKKSKIEPRCEYCEKSYISNETQDLMCEKTGEECPIDPCKKFKYDPLKRVPRKIVINTDFSPEDFQI